MKILVDCNVLLDVMAGREKFLADSARILDGCEAGKWESAIAWHTLANAYYLADDGKKALEYFEDLLSFMTVAGGDTPLAREAVRSGFSDFEDALQSVCAKQFEADFIVTRNVKDFKRSAIPAISPADFLEQFSDCE